jgi:hypothetical protein
MRPGPPSQACVAALALVATAFAAEPRWQPISFTVDPISPLFDWHESWKAAFGGVTNPSRGQVGWGASQRVLDTAQLPPQLQGAGDSPSLTAYPFVGSDFRVYGGLTPSPPDGGPIFELLVNKSAPTTGVHSPGRNGSAISVDLPGNVSSIQVMPAASDGVFIIDAIGFTTRVATN